MFDVLSDKISKPPVQNHDPDDCLDLYPDQSTSSPMSLPISSRPFFSGCQMHIFQICILAPPLLELQD